jgi:23S rRNA pseudouridine2605 synthase
MAERLQKLIAQAGVASRRAAEELILGGRVRLNGRIVKELGVKADLHRDRVEVDGKRLVAERFVYYLLHKPRAVVTTLEDPEGRDTIADLLRGIPERVFPVGRLDYHTSGALLITNDGELAQALLHPRKQVPKQYIAKVKGLLEIRALDALRNGVVLDDGYRTKKAELFVLREEGGNSWLHITINEGKNRQIHRMGMAIGHPVMRLSRVGFAGLTTEGLRPGD